MSWISTIPYKDADPALKKIGLRRKTHYSRTSLAWSAFYAGNGLFGLGMAMAMALFGLHTSLAQRQVSVLG